MLYKWIRQYKGIDSQGKTNASQEEIKRLKNEIQALKKQLATSEQYREILKKAAAYFMAIVGNYVKANPNKWNLPAAGIDVDAISDAYQCNN